MLADEVKKKPAHQRVYEHGGNVYGNLTRPGVSASQRGLEWTYFIFKVLALVSTIFMFVVLGMVCTTTVFGDNPDSAVYVTNTFYTSNDNEQNISWQVLTSNPWNAMPRPGVATYSTINFEHFYECMWTAQLGYTLCSGSTDTVAKYTICLQTKYATELNACAPQGAGLYWPTSSQYTQCINAGLGNNTLWSLNAMRTCVRTNAWPLYDVPQDVTTTFFLGAYSWPLLAITSSFLLLVFALYTIWPVDWEDSTLVEQGKTVSSFVRLGMGWSSLSVLVAGFWLVVVLLIAFRTSSTWPNGNVNLYPSTQQTNVVMVVSTLAVIFYFLLDGSEFLDRNKVGHKYYEDEKQKILHERDEERKRREAEEEGRRKQQAYHDERDMDNQGYQRSMIPTPVSMLFKPVVKPGKPSALGYYFPTPSNGQTNVYSLDEAGKLYMPVLLKTWSDAYLLDPLFIVGLVGGTLQVYTDDIYNVFWCVAFYRIAHAGVARAVHHAYVAIHLTDVDAAYEEALAATKVLALGLHVAGAVAMLGLAMIVLNSSSMLSDYSLVGAYFYLAYLVPEILRLVGHLGLAFFGRHKPGEHYGLYILMLAQFIWTWDLLIRCVYLWVMLWGNSGVRGTKPYLLSGLQSIQTILQL